MVSSIPKWLETLADEIWEWFLKIRIPEHPGRVRFCKEGDLFNPNKRAGLGLSCLALKTLYMLNLLDRLNPNELKGWISYIKSFQTIKGKTEGYFEDPALLKKLDQPLGPFLRRDWNVRRAETRQACAALLCANAKPAIPIKNIPKTPRGVRHFIHRLPWENPWAAGSHASHLMFFLQFKCYFFRR